MESNLIKILDGCNSPLHARDICTRLKREAVRAPEHEVTKVLRGMLREGKTQFDAGRWSLGTGRPQPESKPPVRVTPPQLSPLAIEILGRKALTEQVDIDQPYLPYRKDQTPYEKGAIPTDSGPWARFRRLIAYYKDCVRGEEGAEAMAYTHQILNRFLYLRKSGLWYPRPGMPWRISLPLGDHLGQFVSNIHSAGEGGVVVLGYPVHAVHVSREGEPDTAFLQPVFQYLLTPVVTNGALVLTTENSRPDINLNWLEYNFKGLEQRRAFLSACGFINRRSSHDEAANMGEEESLAGLDVLATTLAAFIPNRVKNPLRPDIIEDMSLNPPFETGIYNRVVLMLGKRTQYHKTLLTELSTIEKATDKELNRSALRHIFRGGPKEIIVEEEEVPHEAIVVDTDPLNAEQRKAVASLLTQDISVVTGPPGTGKSQVVCSTVANTRLLGQAVLFASRNHKAIDAVVFRLNDEERGTLIIRANSRDDSTINVTFSHAIRDLLAGTYEPLMRVNLVMVLKEIRKLLSERGEKARYANMIQLHHDQIGEFEQQQSYLSRELSKEALDRIDSEPNRFPHRAVKHIAKTVHDFNLSESRASFVFRTFQYLKILILIPWFVATRWALKNYSGLPKMPVIWRPTKLRTMVGDMQILKGASDYARLRLKTISLEAKARELPQLEPFTSAIEVLTKRLTKLSSVALSLHLSSRKGLPPDADREELAGLLAALKTVAARMADDELQDQARNLLETRLPMIMDFFPCWAVTNLSVGSRIPLVPGMFDLAVIDEASQSDIPSAIPILFRARRAAVVGDPFQLTHITKISSSRDAMLRKRIGLSQLEDHRFSHSEFSLYDLFTHTKGISPVFLGETYRSVESIAEYSNSTFYSGRLRVATDTAKLKAPPGVKPGIHWTDIAGEFIGGRGQGCSCSDEVVEVEKIVRGILEDGSFRGTLGVVTPFRQQANRIRDAIFENEIPWQVLDAAQVDVNTAHGFQGDERDVMLFSLCGGPEMPATSMGFLRQTGYLFNVAVSRARAVLHVVGNRKWAMRCGIRHIENLARHWQVQRSQRQKSPWHPHESPWEHKLYEALTAKGLNPKPQHPVVGRRLDLALIRKGKPSLKLDIEVDGDRYHRNPDGTRKLDDVWRDIQLQGMGWKVLRFWVYQLREDLDGCVNKIIKIWSDHG